jgi:hypothetical protein
MSTTTKISQFSAEGKTNESPVVFSLDFFIAFFGQKHHQKIQQIKADVKHLPKKKGGR